MSLSKLYGTIKVSLSKLYGTIKMNLSKKSGKPSYHECIMIYYKAVHKDYRS